MKKVGKILLIFLLGIAFVFYEVNAKGSNILDDISRTGKYSALIFFAILSMIIIAMAYLIAKSTNKDN